MTAIQCDFTNENAFLSAKSFLNNFITFKYETSTRLFLTFIQIIFLQIKLLSSLRLCMSQFYLFLNDVNKCGIKY